jgi:hypothetical protein
MTVEAGLFLCFSISRQCRREGEKTLGIGIITQRNNSHDRKTISTPSPSWGDTEKELSHKVILRIFDDKFFH